MPEPPLLVVPLPARLPILTALLGALAEAWEAEYGTQLTTAHMSQESTRWGTALVVAIRDESEGDDRA